MSRGVSRVFFSFKLPPRDARRSLPTPSARSMASVSLSDSQNAVLAAMKLDLLESRQTDSQEKERHAVSRNFCSDTVTAPSPEMLQYALKAASLGDDVFGWDYCTNRLEEHVAKLCGKEAAIFVSSGTMGNQIALKCLLGKPPYSVVCDRRSHVWLYEAGGLASQSGATAIPVVPSNGQHLSLTDIQNAAILTTDIHNATTQVISLENTLWGTIHPQSSIREISKWANAKGLKMHLDGARLWHVAAETGTSMQELCKPFDTVSLCFSKGLGAPAGSVIVGSSETISLARRYRKLLGGGMRQIGILSSCAAYALTHHIRLLPSVHQKAKHLANELTKLGIRITMPVDTCMVWFDPASVGLDGVEIAKHAKELKDGIEMFDDGRLVIHIQTSDQAISDLVGIIRIMIQGQEHSRKGNPHTGAPRGGYGAKL